MLATLTQRVPAGDEWAFEVKWDGVRTIATIRGGKAALISRNGLSYTKQFPELESLPRSVRAKTAVIDGEIVAVDASGKSSFQALQPRLGVAGAGGQNSKHRIVYYVFDLLSLDGKDLTGLPLSERKALLARILTPSPAIQLSSHATGDGEKLLEAARAKGLEGLVAKRLDSPYTPGRSRDWLKIKIQKRDEFLICGWTEGKRELAALVLGTRAGDGLEWAGNVGTGFDVATARQLLGKLKKLRRQASPFSAGKGPRAAVHWVEPELVAEIKYAERTTAGKLRAPVFLGLRQDKEPEEVVQQPSTKPLPSFVTHPDKIYFPQDGLRKADLLEYYDSVAPAILPHLKDRPLSMRRFPDGIDRPSFFQKNVTGKTPRWFETVVLYSEYAKRDIRYALAGDRDSLLYLVNLGCIDHNPWMSRVKSLDSPDYVLVDLDPHECGFPQVVEAALAVGEILKSLKLEALVKTSGAKGLHVIVPLAPGHTYGQVRHFTEVLAGAAARLHPKLFTLERTIAKRPRGRVYFDWVQIGQGKTIAAPYSVRPKPGAPVSAPLAWSELTPSLRPDEFDIGNMPERWKQKGDLFLPPKGKRQKLDEIEEIELAG